MRRKILSILVITVLVLAVALAAGCGPNKLKPLKYPGADAEVGKPSTPPEKAETSGDEGGGSTLDFKGDTSGGGQAPPPASPGKTHSIESPVAPYGSEPVGNNLQAEPTKDGETAGDTGTTPAAEEGKDPTATGDATAISSEDDKNKSHKDKTPDKYKQGTIGEYAFFYNNPDESEVGNLNSMIEAINLLTVNEQKYKEAEAFLTPEAKGFSRGDPLFIPEAVPDELRPLIPGEGLAGSLDQELIDLFRSQMKADLRTIPIQISGVMDQGGSQICIGYVNGQKFMVGNGQSAYTYYKGNTGLSITAAYISEDLVILNLALVQFTRRGARQITDPVPRSFHIGIT